MPETVKASNRLPRYGMLVGAVAALSECASVPQDLEDSRLALYRGALSGAKYSMDGSEPQGVCTFLGTYDDEYLELLASQPDALAVANQARPFQSGTVAVTVGFGIYGIVEITAALSSDTDSFADSRKPRAIRVTSWAQRSAWSCSMRSFRFPSETGSTSPPGCSTRSSVQPTPHRAGQASW